MLVFIPKYDLRGPLFLKDTRGTVIFPPAAFVAGASPRDSAGRAAAAMAARVAALNAAELREHLYNEGSFKHVLPGASLTVDSGKEVTPRSHNCTGGE